MADLVASIRECAADRLAGFMPMHDRRLDRFARAF
jgi:hypothetical protein